MVPVRALPAVVLAASLLAPVPPVAAAPTRSHPKAAPAAASRQLLALTEAIAAADGDRGHLDLAATRLAAGDPDGAISACKPALEGPADGARCRLLSAEAALTQDRPAEAAGLLAPVRGKLGVLEPWGALLQGEALAASGDPVAALKALDEATAADPDGPLGRRAAPGRVLALARAGREADAKAAAAVLGGRLSPRVRLILADAEAAAGDPAAGAAYRDLWHDLPGTPEADRAATRLAELAAKGVAVPPATAADRLYRADRLLDHGRLELASRELDELAKAGNADAGQRSRAALLAARAAAARGERDVAEKLLAPLLAARTGDVVPDALEIGARLAMRRGELDAAVGRLDRLAKDFPDHRLATEAEYLAAFFLYDAGRFDEAGARFRAFAAAHPRAGRADEAAWYAAWSIYRAGQHADAAQAFADFLVRYPKSSLAPQVRYWRGRALERAGDRKAARIGFLELSRDPDGWYPLLARLRLGGKAAAPATPAVAARDAAAATRTAAAGAAGVPAPLAPVDPATAAGPDAARAPGAGASRAPAGPDPAAIPLRTDAARARLARAVALYAAGLAEPAGDELDAALRGENRVPVLEAVAALALRAGDAFRAHRLGLRLPPDRGDALAYPRAFAADVERAASGLDVDPHFVWAIMRQESAFRPAIRSSAAAIGLLQLLPSTARQICQSAGLDAGQAERLGEPAVNVTLGTWYLSRLLARFGGNPALAAAAYNAGPDAVARWLVDRKGLELDEFVESIPYKETRGYVKRVIGNLAAYRRLVGEPPPALAGALPEAAPGVSF
jgi:soluble lytic murein transglycosylase